MEKAFAEWPRSLWADNSLKWDFPEVELSNSFDVVIVGAGYSGLWTAHHLLNFNPSLSVAILDACQPGFGASGRNGGWCSAFSPMSLEAIASQSDREGARELQNALVASVDEIGSYIANSGIDCGWHKGGTLSFASSQLQLQAIKETIEMSRDFGYDDSFMTYLSPEQAENRVHVRGSHGASYSPHCAALHPAQLVDGLVNQLLGRNVQIFGSTQVTEINPHQITARTYKGTVVIDAKWIVRATEGFTARMKQYRRDVAPLYSYMIATEPLSDAQWQDIGWTNRETVSDGRNLIIYVQRTADGRIAFGGRGAPYKFASRIGSDFDNNPKIHSLIETSMREMFPSIDDVAITHRWGGALGVHRDWFASANVNHKENIATLGGYVGDGVAFSYVAAKEVARNIVGERHDARPLPIVNHVSPRWEPEPFRYVGINSILRLTERADESEKRTGRKNRFVNWLLGKLIP
ncbi:MAG: FAD-binding oxidoreductase [Ilumatobacteraceae bacterium]|jgi:glycine/D-amino acid oxidase-like deaminating enzyme|nr:FAD-binding oxidoreductase [Ilumatobacteraceae bacterium]MDP5068835.1 FAD-binding oxidoreductase [Ilumatobacteraceae bacterium]